MSPPRAGTAECVQACSSVPSAASRTARRGRLRRGFRRRSLTDAAYPLRVRALRSVYRTPAVGRDHWARRCRNYRLCTNLFPCTVCRFADGTPSGRALRSWNAPHRRARPLGAPVQELPSAYKLVRLYRLPLRGRRGHVPALQLGGSDEEFGGFYPF